MKNLFFPRGFLFRYTVKRTLVIFTTNISTHSEIMVDFVFFTLLKETKNNK